MCVFSFGLLLYCTSCAHSLLCSGRKAVFSITAVKRMSNAKTTHLSAAAQALAPHLEQYKEESEKESIDEDRNVMHYGDDPDSQDGSSVPTSPNVPHTQTDSHGGAQLTKALKEMSIDQPGT